jgi:hypothetical protein
MPASDTVEKQKNKNEKNEKDNDHAGVGSLIAC